jgi:ABC-type glutathione transport system ATPase component
MMSRPINLLTVKNLSIFIKDQPIIQDVSFEVFQGEKVALSGPSGSGKTLTAYSLANLLDKKFRVSAQSMFLVDHSGNKTNLLNLKNFQYHQIGFVFQDPQVALNPLISIGKQLKEGLENFYPLSVIDDKIQALLIDLNLPTDVSFLEAFPHELSGGQQQRVVIGMAIAKNPRILIADEPTTSLDSKTTVEILELIMRMVDQKNMSLLLITHDGKIINKYCDRILPFPRNSKMKSQINSQSQKNPEYNNQNKILIELKNISLYLRRRKNGFQPILQNLSTTIHQGEIIGLVGKSGGGKSSLCKIVSGLIKIQNGTLNCNCQPHQIQLVQQDPFQSLNPKFSVEESIGEVIRHYHKDYDPEYLESKISSILFEVGLSDEFLKRKPFELSGGERQRVAIARSLAAEPKLLICDEAVSALDSQTQEMIIDLLIELNINRQMAILFVTHDLSRINFCHTIWVLDGGIIVEKISNNNEKLNLTSSAGQELVDHNNFFKK